MKKALRLLFYIVLTLVLIVVLIRHPGWGVALKILGVIAIGCNVVTIGAIIKDK